MENHSILAGPARKALFRSKNNKLSNNVSRLETERKIILKTVDKRNSRSKKLEKRKNAND